MVNDFNGFRCTVRTVMTVILYLKVEYVSVNNKRMKRDCKKSTKIKPSPFALENIRYISCNMKRGCGAICLIFLFLY